MQKGLLMVIAGFTVGVAFRSFFDFGLAFAVFLVLVGSAIAALFLVKRKSAVILFTGICIASVGFGVLRFELSLDTNAAHALDEFTGTTVLIEGIVSDEPDIREMHTKLTLAPENVSFAGVVRERRTKLLLVVAEYPEFHYGDRVRVRGVPLKPDRIVENEDSTGRPFNYAAYLAKDGIFYEMFYPHVELVSSSGGNAFKRALFSLKHFYIEGLHQTLPEPHATLGGGITVGAKEALGDEILRMFRTAGIIHIVVLSGYNITIIARVVERALAFLPRFAGLGLSAAGIVLFAVMTGAGATIVRASLMALLVILARATGRVSEITVALFVAAFLMLLANPHILAFDPSFQLSFAATMGLLFLAPRAERFFKWLPAQFGIREAATATVATQIAVLPLLLYMMGEFSVVSFPVNLLILPLVPLAMLFSFLSSVTSAFLSVFSIPFSFAAWVLLEYTLGVSRFFAALPFASFHIAFPLFAALGAYGALAVFLYASSRFPTSSRKAGMRHYECRTYE